MLKKSNRLNLRKSGDFFLNARKYQGRSFLFYYQLGSGKFALVIPKKVVAKAVKRNRLKRVLKNKLEFLLNRQRYNLNGVFILKKSSLPLDEDYLKKELEEILKKHVN